MGLVFAGGEFLQKGKLHLRNRVNLPRLARLRQTVAAHDTGMVENYCTVFVHTDAAGSESSWNTQSFADMTRDDIDAGVGEVGR